MKKKLKVQKAFRGKLIINRGRLINPIRPNVNPAIDRGLVRPGTISNPNLIDNKSGPVINPAIDRGLVRPGTITNPNFIHDKSGPGIQPGFQQIIQGPDGNPIRNLPGPIQQQSSQPLPPMQPSSQINPNSPRSLPFASGVGPSMQGVGPTQTASPVMSQPPVIPNPSIGAAQAAPAQPIAAMKKGGYIRGGRAEIKGHRKAKLF